MSEDLNNKQKVIIDLFEAQVKKTPHRIAVIHKDRKITYHELDKRAEQIASALAGMGVGPETVTGILSKRSIEALAGILGVLKAGGAYLAIDPAYPTERVRYMLEDAAVNILLVTKETAHVIDSGKFKKVLIEETVQNEEGLRVPMQRKPVVPDVYTI